MGGGNLPTNILQNIPWTTNLVDANNLKSFVASDLTDDCSIERVKWFRERHNNEQLRRARCDLHIFKLQLTASPSEQAETLSFDWLWQDKIGDDVHAVKRDGGFLPI